MDTIWELVSPRLRTYVGATWDFETITALTGSAGTRACSPL